MKKLKYQLKRFINIFGLDIMPLDFRNSVQNFLIQIIGDHDIKEIWDIGANTGQYGSMLRNIGYKGKIISFEAMPKETKILKRRSESDKYWTVFGPIAISSKKGTKKLFVTKDSVSSSLLKPLKSEVVDTIEVSTDKLEKYLKSSSANKSHNKILKLDIQGSEIEAINSAGKYLSAFSFIQCEASITSLYQREKNYLDIISFMKKKGYRPVFFFPGVYDDEKSIIQLEIFFRKNIL